MLIARFNISISCYIKLIMQIGNIARVTVKFVVKTEWCLLVNKLFCMLFVIRRPQRLQSELDTGDDESNTTSASKKAKVDSKIPLVPVLYVDTNQYNVLETNDADEQNDNTTLDLANETDQQPIPGMNASSLMLDNQLPDEQVFDDHPDTGSVGTPSPEQSGTQISELCSSLS